MAESSLKVSCLKASNFPDKFVHGFPTRYGGVSKNNTSSLNLYYSPKRSDTAENVQENRRRLAEAEGFELSRLHVVSAVHSARVYIIGQEKPSNGYDAVIGQEAGDTAGALHADCCPILLVDPHTNTFAAIHSGWRGSIDNVIGETIKAMQSHFSVSPSNILAAIGPTIRGCCYEVGPEVVSQFVAKFPDLPSMISQGPVKEHLDIPTVIIQQLLDCGVMRANISEDCLVCTKCDPQQRFFSYRRDGFEFGNHLSFVGRRA